MAELSRDLPALTYSIDPVRGIVLFEYPEAQPTFDEWRAAVDAVLRDPRFRQGMNVVSDRRRLTGAPKTSTLEQMARYVAEHRAQIGRCRCAVVTRPHAPIDFGVVRMTAVFLEFAGSSVAMRPFTDIQKAIEWACSSGVH